jgi:radical SAM protein with 4Fe4S-binding SPASM domain
MDKAVSSQKKNMPLQKYIELLDDCRGLSVNGHPIDAVRMDGNRELFVYPKWREAVEETFKRGFNILLFTNGVLLNSDASEFLLRHNLRRITFSISGITPETYYKYQGFSSKGGIEFAEKQLSKVISNIKEFMRLKNEIAPSIFVEISCLLGKEDIDEKKKSVEFFGDLGVDCFFAPTMINIQQDSSTKNSDTFLFRQQGVTNQLSNCEKHDKYKNFRSPYRDWCYLIIVSSNGDIHTCCEIGGGEQITLGNVFEKPLSQIIKSKEWFDFYDALASRDFERMHPICRDCRAVVG